LRLGLQELTFSNFTDRKTLTVDRAELLRTVSARSLQSLHHDRIERALEALREHARQHRHTLWDICAGHDLVELLRIGLRKLFGTCQESELKTLERIIRSAYQDEWFRQTSLYAEMQAWHQRHPVHGLLTQP
jgi:hypothetical protein